MQDPAFLKYIEYFKRQPRAQQYYYIVGSRGSVSAKEVSKQAQRSIQTATNALRDLQRIGLLKSEKKGRVRTYALKDRSLFNGLLSQYPLQVRATTKRVKEDVIATSIFNQNMEKWMKYLATILEGTLYVNHVFRTSVLDFVEVDYVIENQRGQNVIMIIHINDAITCEAAIGRIFSLIVSKKDIIPTLSLIFAVCLVYEESLATMEKMTRSIDFANSVSNSFSRLSDAARNFKVVLGFRIEKVQSGDLAKADFAEKLSLNIAESLPVYFGESLPGESGFDVPGRRRRALEAIQNKIGAKKGRTLFLPALREVLPRDDELKRWLDPEILLRSYGLKEGDAFVDVGCFEGLFTIPAAKIVGEEGVVYGIELSSVFLEKIKSYASQNKLENIVLKNDLPENVMLDNNIADIVFYGVTLIDLFNPVKSLKNAYSMLKDSGKLIVFEWKEGDLEAGPSSRWKLRKGQIIALLEASGFKIETMREEGNYHISVIATKSQKQSSDSQQASIQASTALRR